VPNLGESTTASSSISTVKLLLLGDTKAGKTHYLMQAAAAGFNVLYIDGDVGIQTLMQLPAEARKRIFYLNVADRTSESGLYESRMAKFFVEFSTTGKFMWNDTKGEVFNRNSYTQLRGDPADSAIVDAKVGDVIGGDVVWEIRPARMTGDTLVVIDSWTTLIQSLVNWKAEDLAIDLLDIEKHGREMYTGAGHKATQFLTLLKGFRCHVGVIGHPREYIKRSPPPGSKGVVAEKDMKIDWTRMVPISTSNPHALTMGKHFSDIAWIDINAMGKRTIDFRPSNERVIGGHFNQKADVDELSFAKLVEQIGGTIPSNPDASAWLTQYGPGQFEIAGSAKAPLTGSSSQTATQVTGLKGFAALRGGSK
jgi:hypothetical protein